VTATVNGGIAILRVRQRKIELAQLLRLPPESVPVAFHEPRSTDGRRIAGWAELPSQPREAVPRAMLIECDRVTLRCVSGAVASSSTPPRVVYNPSRP
jgi:hypothetical protein